MSVYTVHEPPLRPAEASAEPERFVFVRDGFAWGAFLLPPLWMLRHRLWLVLVLYGLAIAGIDAVLRSIGASMFFVGLVGFVTSLLVGLEAGTLRRFTLTRRRWRNVGVVSGDDLEDAERRFFDAWFRKAPGRAAAPVTPPGAPLAAPRPAAAAVALPAAASRTPEPSDVIGLFPEPGARR